MSKLLRIYRTTLQKYPVMVQSLQVGLLLGTSDAITQRCIEQRFQPKTFDFARNRNFMLIGTCIIGPSSSVWFTILDRYIKGKPAQKALKKVICDQFFFAPCFLAMFLMMLETLEKRSVADAKKAMSVYYLDILKMNYIVWPLVQLCNFYLVPVNYQTLFAQCIALIWNVFISYKTHLK